MTDCDPIQATEFMNTFVVSRHLLVLNSYEQMTTTKEKQTVPPFGTLVY